MSWLPKGQGNGCPPSLGLSKHPWLLCPTAKGNFLRGTGRQRDFIDVVLEAWGGRPEPGTLGSKSVCSHWDCELHPLLQTLIPGAEVGTCKGAGMGQR